MSSPRDRLAEYNARRDFSKTAEPNGEPTPPRKSGLKFVVQKHAARRLHYDLRLEWEGVLLSWAVTRGPSDEPSEKRLAVRTEDHPLTYGDFEGSIPKGEYGAGTVMLWDRGLWEPLHDPGKGLEEGKLHFIVHGERMKGGWVLVRMRGKPKEKRQNWLLIKERDRFAGDDPDRLTERFTESIETRRSLDAIATGKRPKASTSRRGKGAAGRTRATASRLKAPKFRKPQLATLVGEVPEGDDWLHEMKFDGYRCLASLGKNGVRLYTRSGLDWTGKFAVLVRALETIACDNALIDGEVTAHAAGAASAFSALQRVLKEGGDLDFYAFDLLVHDGADLTKRPLIDRKEILAALIGGARTREIHYSEHVRGHGAQALEHICENGGEGIISKRAGASYRGARSRAWLKIKCTRRQEFVVGGFAPSSKRGRAFASLLVGQYVGDDLQYRGRVGSGFSEAEIGMLGAELKRLARKTSPFGDVPGAVAAQAQWVSPKLVVEVDFAEFTDDGYIRHGSFLGLREDKVARMVKPERAQSRASDDSAEVEGIRISSPGRQVFPNAELTKLDLAEYYGTAGERITAIASHRPLSLVRCPEGVSRECFYQKHAGRGFPKQLRTVDIEESDGEVGTYLYVASPAGLVAAAQMGTIEFHAWGARTDNLEKPDRLVFDLDPDEGLAFDVVKKAAFECRDRLQETGLASVPMVTGGKGVHVIVPLRRTISWQTLKTFAKTFASAMAERAPDRYTATMSKAKRRGKVFIDWLRNERGATAIVPYSVRARRGAPVAVPVTWDELTKINTATAFDIAAGKRRLTAPCPYLEAARRPQTLGKSVVERLEKLIGAD